MTDEPQYPEATEPPAPDLVAPDHTAPGPAERRDELLSAALDGALIGAVGDLGATPDEIAALESAGARARQADLRAAGRTIAAVPPLDEVTRARLVRAAVESGSLESASGRAAESTDITPRRAIPAIAGRRERSRRWLVPAASVAAVAALAGGLGVALDDDGRQVADTTSLAAEDLAESAALVVDYGEIDDATLRSLVTTSDGPLGPDDPPTVESGKGDVSTAGAESDPSRTFHDPVSYDTVAAASCLAELNPGGVLPQVIGIATVEGRAALVAVADEPGRRFGWVVSTDTPCAVLLSTMVTS